MSDHPSVQHGHMFRIIQAMNAIRSELGIPPSSKEYLEDYLLSEPMADLIGDLTRECDRLHLENVGLRANTGELALELEQARQTIEVQKVTIADLTRRRERELARVQLEQVHNRAGQTPETPIAQTEKDF